MGAWDKSGNIMNEIVFLFATHKLLDFDPQNRTYRLKLATQKEQLDDYTA